MCKHWAEGMTEDTKEGQILKTELFIVFLYVSKCTNGVPQRVGEGG